MRIEFLAVLFMALMCICAVSAADDDYFNENTTVTIHGFDFTIPEGFDPFDVADVNETEDGITTISKFFVNGDGEVVMLSVIYGDDINKDLDSYKSVGENPKKMTVNGQEGLNLEKNGYKFFVYLKDDSAIILQAPDDGYFEGMMDK